MGCCGRSTKVEPIKIKNEEGDSSSEPVKKRGCTDVFCVFIFILFLGGMGYVAFQAILLGNPYRLVFGADNWGNVCGRKNEIIENVTLSGRDMTDYSNLFYLDYTSIVTKGNEAPRLCIKTCPSQPILTVSGLQNLTISEDNRLCRYDIQPAHYTNGTLGSDDCPTLPVLPHKELFHRCIPTALLSFGKSVLEDVAVKDVFNNLEAQCSETGTILEKISGDLQKVWREILYLCGISFVVALAVTVMMRFFAAFIIWVLLIGCALGTIGATAFCWYTWYEERSLLADISIEDQPDSAKEHVRNWMIYACVASGIMIAVLLILLVLRKRVGLVVQLFRESGKAVAKMPFLLIQPLWTLLVLAIFLGGFLAIFMYIETAGTAVVAEDTGYVTFKKDQLMFYMQWYHIFGMLWTTQFVFACQQMVIAGAVAAWYFTRDKTTLGSPIRSSIGRLIRYHLGSVLFGSFIIALVQLARLILGYIQARLRGKTSKIISFILKCLQCVLWCFEKMLKFINRNAYIMIAMYGYNFCRGAQRAFVLLVSNAVRVAVINSVGTFCLFLGKVAVAAIVAIIGFQILKSRELCYIWAPVGVTCLFSYCISNCFLSVYGMAIDTIFLCFCEDCEKNDGVQKPFFMSQGLMEYIENSKHALVTAENKKSDKKEEPKQ